MKDLHFNKEAILHFIKRFHLVLFVTITVLLLSVAVLLLMGVVGKSTGNDALPSANTSAFDEATIKRIENLKTSDDPSQPLDLTQGRINPFSE